MEPMQFADEYMIANQPYFLSSKIYIIKNLLKTLPEHRQILVQSTDLKNPLVTLLLSLFIGYFGIDCFYLGDIG